MGRRAMALLALASLLATAGLAHGGETRALILTIGDYIEPKAKLQGIQEDARMALEIVKRLGARDVVQWADRQVHRRGLQQALRELRARTRPGDTVIIYYSGHGRRQAAAGNEPISACQESLVTVDNLNFFDSELHAEMQALAALAARVIVFNDSCHSAGAAVRGLDLSPRGSDDQPQPKAWPADLPEADERQQYEAMKQASPEAQGACAVASNAATRSFSLGPGPEARLVYLAAAAADEVAWATPQGSQATQAWHRCVIQPRPSDDANGDGMLSAGELARCAQRWVQTRFPRYPQRITPLFNTAAPFVPVANGAGR